MGDANEALLDMTKSASQWYNQMSIANVTVPKFAASQDVYDFVTEYEDATSNLTEEQRTKLLNKAFPPGDHRSWFEVELKPLIDSLKPWSVLKSKIIDRFSTQEDQDRHFTRLRELKYNPDGSRMLLDFIDDMVYSYSRAYGDGFNEQSCIRFIKSSLPSQVQASLSASSDYRDANNVTGLKRAAKQHDLSRKMDPKASTDRQVTSELAVTLKELVTSIRKELVSCKEDNMATRKDNEATRKEVFNAFRQQQQTQERLSRPNPSYNYRRSPSPGFRRRSPSPRTGEGQQLSVPKPGTGNETQRQVDTKKGTQRNAFNSQSYFEVFGMPPSPCSLCNENSWHWSKHCLKHLN